LDFKSAMQLEIDHIVLIENDMEGTLAAVTNPEDLAYYINEDGLSAPTFHILYYDLMKQHSILNMDNYGAQLNEQRWMLYRSFYLEAKRKTKLKTEYNTCPSAVADLELMSTLPTSEQGIKNLTSITIGNDVLATAPLVSDKELEASLQSIQSHCGQTINAADRQTILGLLRTYFNSNPNNLLRIIIDSDWSLGDNNLVAIYNILWNGYGCSLNEVLAPDIAQCDSYGNDEGGGALRVAADGGGQTPLTQNLIANPANGAVCRRYSQTNATVKAWSVTQQMWTDAVANCVAKAIGEREILIEYATTTLINTLVNEYYTSSTTNCLANAEESLVYKYKASEYHYTLYYYDQAGNLVQTVPPKGVMPIIDPIVINDAINGNPHYPDHKLVTRYQFSSLNQNIKATIPDAGISQTWYNDKGQLRLSQNAQQFIDKKYSYTRYDALGRIEEVGELYSMLDISVLKTNLLHPDFPQAATYTLKDITKTFYDFVRTPAPDHEGAPFAQENLRTRVSYSVAIDDPATVTEGSANEVATFYTYDIHGNVRSLLQKVPGLGTKRTDYLYDLVSGKVNYVIYQHGQPDQFMHRYTYDADNRIREVNTSMDGWLWDRDAEYKYYHHGPLARVVLGDRMGVQGLDYYYTLQGWIKGVNMPYSDDLTNDGHSGSATAPRVGRDVFAYTLGYYNDDYTPSNPLKLHASTRDNLWERHATTMGNSGYFNGNIAWMITDLKKVGQEKLSRAKGMQAMLYKYDQLHRIVQSRSLTAYTPGATPATTQFEPKAATAYDEDFSFDPNGNLLTLKRKNETGIMADNFTYSYYDETNKLRGLGPLPPAKVLTLNNSSTADLSDVYYDIIVEGGYTVPPNANIVLRATHSITFNAPFDLANTNANGTDNGKGLTTTIVNEADGMFKYDAIGNLITDVEQNVTIAWTPYGKVRQVTKGDGSTLTFRYDATGNRLEKKMRKADGTGNVTRYLRDASGNVMGVYSSTITLGAEGIITVSEQPIYGSARLGMYKGGRVTGEQKLGTKNYELSNHLGNVLTVITDNIRLQADSAWATVVNARDYYAFGSEMPGRSYAAPAGTGAYRYGFNGKEKDTETTWGDNSYDYGFRIYNPRYGRFLSVDPLTKSYPMLTPYQFASNTPIAAVDLDGLEGVVAPPAPPIILLPPPPAPTGSNSNNGAIRPKHTLDAEFWGMGEPFRMLIKAYTPDWIDQDDFEKQELDFYEIRLIKDGSLSDWEEDRYLDLLAKHKGIYLTKKDLKNPNLFLQGPQPSKKMFGEEGAIIQSKTIWKEKDSKARIDVENPNPGQRPGQIHYQDENNNKFMYDPDQDRFYGKDKKSGEYNVPAPNVDMMLKNPEFRNAVDKGKRMLGSK
jgi:RHS repeat-associated protein